MALQFQDGSIDGNRASLGTVNFDSVEDERELT